MPRDYANIYNLPEEDRKKEIKNLWDNSIPGTEELAKSILRKIEEDEYPYVLSVEASYGMGKTYFFSRFCEYAKKNGLDCIYISAWENDYQPTPFLFICEKIKKYMEEKDSSAIKSNLSSFINSSLHIMKEITKSSEFNVPIYKFITLNIKNVFSKNKHDSIKDFKRELTQLIVKTRTKPLILVIDELDRCRPDYALKTLEVIKHFFDVDNLYVILPINKEAVERMVKAIYGEIQDSENYLKKLINQNLILLQPTFQSYQKLINAHITKEKLKQQIKKKYIDISRNYNGFDLISESIAKYASEGKLTYRETVAVCNEFVCIVKQIKQNIQVEYLAYLLCNKYKHNNVNLDASHLFYNGTSQQTNKKYNILTLLGLYSITNRILGLIPNNFQWGQLHNDVKIIQHSDHFNSYEEIYAYFDKLEKIKPNIFNTSWNSQLSESFKKLYSLIDNSKNRIKEYQLRSGSSDEDSKNKSFYDNVIDNPLSIYSK